MQDKERISLTDAEALIYAALVAQGVKAQAAQATAHALVSAEAEGQVGHGFSRLEDYVGQVRTGKLNANANVATTHDTLTGIRVDADCGFAYPAMDIAITQGIDIAKKYGSASMSIYNSHHCGALSLQVEKLAKAGLVGFMFANAPAAIAPWGGSVPIFGTNPIAFAVPRAGAEPLVIDLSLSKVARGKVMNAKKTGKEIPLGWALDKDGAPTTDPDAALNGSMVPMGDAKGTALVLMVEIMASLFTGANLSKDSGSFFTAAGEPPRVGQFLMAFDIGANAPTFLNRLEGLIGLILDQENTRLPGDRRLAARKSAAADGILVPKQYLDAARALASA
jgi:(2R)-3-sulfolactate dehydrogenase (NADP+)